ncbi:MAG: BLUF domain-containing protein [Burkholderiaceae bacterium]|nr:BLUF domain-containing protein [Burkholderiaceae bacterium]
MAPQTEASTESILRTAHGWNAQHGITGVLCQGQGVFLQVLEGERGKVTSLYARILIHCESIGERRYGDWSMAHVRLSDVDPQARIVWPDFDPYSPSGLLVMARIDELVTQGRVIQSSPP